MIKAAEAEAESKFLQGQGMARQRQASETEAGLQAGNATIVGDWLIVPPLRLIPVHLPPHLPLTGHHCRPA